MIRKIILTFNGKYTATIDVTIDITIDGLSVMKNGYSNASTPHILCESRNLNYIINYKSHRDCSSITN